MTKFVEVCIGTGYKVIGKQLDKEGVDLERMNFQVAFGLRNRHRNQYYEEDSEVWGWLPTIIEKGPHQLQKNRIISVHKCTE